MPIADRGAHILVRVSWSVSGITPLARVCFREYTRSVEADRYPHSTPQPRRPKDSFTTIPQSNNTPPEFVVEVSISKSRSEKDPMMRKLAFAALGLITRAGRSFARLGGTAK